jgi:hypothetical protein
MKAVFPLPWHFTLSLLARAELPNLSKTQASPSLMIMTVKNPAERLRAMTRDDNDIGLEILEDSLEIRSPIQVESIIRMRLSHCSCHHGLERRFGEANSRQAGWGGEAIRRDELGPESARHKCKGQSRPRIVY